MWATVSHAQYIISVTNIQLFFIIVQSPEFATYMSQIKNFLFCKVYLSFYDIISEESCRFIVKGIIYVEYFTNNGKLYLRLVQSVRVANQSGKKVLKPAFH